MYKICFYVPHSHVEIVKNKMFESGAGHIGNYRCCSFQTLGQGQFMPLKGSHAFIGTLDQIEIIDEYKVEMVCAVEQLHHAIAALKSSHPYEEPAYQIIKLEEI